MKRFHLWQNAWKAGYEEPIPIDIPDSWNVTYHAMPGDTWQKLDKDALRQKIRTPLNGRPIHEFAVGGQEAVIVFDDLSRGTPTKEIAEIVLDELREAGVDKRKIRFICATGTHAAMTREDFVKKLGEEIVSQYPVFNHNAFYGCTQIGINRRNEPVLINQEFMQCDIKIGIGAVSPHPTNGYGGGGKLLFPGLAHINTTINNHKRREFTKPGTQITDCGLRKDIEEMTHLVGPVFMIDAVINAKLDIVALFAGDPSQVYYEAAKVSSVANLMDFEPYKDVVICNANAKYNESLVAVDIGSMELKPGGDLVLINHCPVGQVVHYTFGAFGLNNGGELWRPYKDRSPLKCGRLIYYTPWPDPCSALQLDEPDKVVFARNWNDVLDLLSNHGRGTEASILSDGCIGYFPKSLDS